MKQFFEILKKSPSIPFRAGPSALLGAGPSAPLRVNKKSKARLGVLHTPHGDILTPSFVPVATKGTLKSIPPKDFKDIGVQVAFVNTFHLSLHPGGKVLEKFGGIHTYAGLSIPLMSDSAGFQVFSLGRPNKKRKYLSIRSNEDKDPMLLKIGEDGVSFRSPTDGREIVFTPEFSIEEQGRIGADIMMAFDECIYNGADKEYAREATQRTHEWLLRCIKTKGGPSTRSARSGLQQFLYGIVQGGMYKDLREESAKFVSKQDISGIAIGGVSVGETTKEMKDIVNWVVPYLPEELPRHLLGVGRLEDIEYFVKQGMDTFDCTEPTRFARNGTVFVKNKGKIGRVDVRRSVFLKQKGPIEKGCLCYTCQNFSLSFLHHAFKERELLGYYLATYHNLFFFEREFKRIREQIALGYM